MLVTNFSFSDRPRDSAYCNLRLDKGTACREIEVGTAAESYSGMVGGREKNIVRSRLHK